jgi:hypothetical protein
VLVEGELCEVSTFANLVPSKRPQAICPICQQLVILKLGAKRVHHYAHRPEINCTATHSETALHLNTKFYIYHQLLGASTIYVEQRCSNYCGLTRKLVWLEDWDEVNVEYSLSPFRPDIALKSSGQVIGAVEVAVTHYTDDSKTQFFQDNNIAWIEIKGDTSIYEGEKIWKPDLPLPFSTYHPKAKTWTCDKCQEKQKREIEKREYERHNYKIIHAAKIVDFYFKSGKKYREVYFVMKQVRSDQWVMAWIKTGNNKIVATVESNPITENHLKQLNEQIKKRIDYEQSKGTIVDQSMEWKRWKPGHKFVARDTERFPFRFLWDRRLKKWREV